MNIQSIRKLITRVVQPQMQQEVMLGRWRLTYTEKTVDKTIERANEDHCGTCVNHPKEAEEVPVKHS
jgi:hypothetical protein